MTNKPFRRDDNQNNFTCDHQSKSDCNFPTDCSPMHPHRNSRRPSSVYREWLGRKLYQFNDTDWWTVRDAVEGAQAFGGTGSGKTSGSGKNHFTSFIRNGFGGVFLSAQGSDLETLLGYFEDAGVDPKDRLVVLSPESGYRFNPLSYEYMLGAEKSGRGDTRRLVNLFMTAIGSGSGEISKTDPYWNDALRELLTHGVDLVDFATGSSQEGRFRSPEITRGIRLADVEQVVRSAPRTMHEAKLATWVKTSQCGQMLLAADETYKELGSDEPRIEDLKDTVGYWLRSFPNLSDRTRSVIVSSFTAKANALLRQPLRDLFCTDTSPEVTPEATFGGKVVFIDLPVKVYGEAGRLAQVLYKTVWQHAVESRRRWLSGPSEWKPVFLWADESQNFVTAEDVLFQATARGRLAATFYLTQNVSNYYHALGGAGTSATDSLLGSLQMKIFHANGDPATNEYAERLFGTDKRNQGSTSHSFGGQQSSYSHSSSRQKTREPILPASMFTKLVRGGGPDGVAEAVVFHAGRRWAGPDGRCNFLIHKYQQ